jgi:hypothetical protein
MEQEYRGELNFADADTSPGSAAMTRFTRFVGGNLDVHLKEAWTWPGLDGERYGFVFETTPTVFDKFASSCSLRQPADALEEQAWKQGSQFKMRLLFKRPLPIEATQLWAGEPGGIHYELWVNAAHTDVYLMCETGNAVYE